jgi:hypothetical protein
MKRILSVNNATNPSGIPQACPAERCSFATDETLPSIAKRPFGRNIQLSVFVAEALKAFVASIETLDAFCHRLGALIQHQSASRTGWDRAGGKGREMHGNSNIKMPTWSSARLSWTGAIFLRRGTSIPVTILAMPLRLISTSTSGKQRSSLL